MLLGALMWAALAGAPHWPAGAVIRVWIAPTGALPGAESLVERAMKTWTDAAGGRLKLEKTVIREGAALRVRFVTEGGLYGETRPRVDRDTGSIVAADVFISAVAAEVAPDAFGKQIIIYLTALHEIGHALGLTHTENFNTIMYLFRFPDDGERYFARYRQHLHSADDIGSAAATGLAVEDVAALRALYDQ